MRKHAFDVTAFVWGSLFLGAATLYYLNEHNGLAVNGRWFFPAALIAAGITGLANAFKTLRR